MWRRRPSNLAVAPANGNVAEPVKVSFEVKNTGSRQGAEIVELYVGNPQAGVPRPLKELKGFAKVNLKPGESKRVDLMLDRRAFSYYDANKKGWNAAPGEYGILVGSSSDKIQLQEKFTLEP